MVPWSMFQMAMFQLKWLHGLSQMPVSNADIMSYKKFSKHSEINLYCVPSHFSLLFTLNHTFCSSCMHGNLWSCTHPVQKFHTTMSTFPACRALRSICSCNFHDWTPNQSMLLRLSTTILLFTRAQVVTSFGACKSISTIPYLGLC
jgi:hypothetical protein